MDSKTPLSERERLCLLMWLACSPIMAIQSLTLCATHDALMATVFRKSASLERSGLQTLDVHPVDPDLYLMQLLSALVCFPGFRQLKSHSLSYDFFEVRTTEALSLATNVPHYLYGDLPYFY